VVVVHFSDADLRKEVRALVVSQEEHIESMSMGSYHAISAALAEPLHCQKRRAPVVLFGHWLVPAVKIRLIFADQPSFHRVAETGCFRAERSALPDKMRNHIASLGVRTGEYQRS
jgi:hypothetical protein